MSRDHSPVPEDGASEKFAANWLKEHPLEFIGGFASAAYFTGWLGWEGYWGFLEFGISMIPGGVGGALIEAGIDNLVPQTFAYVSKIAFLFVVAFVVYLLVN